jgi:hypothetical protein
MPTYNLIYNLCISFVNPILYFNVSNLKRYIHKFNGKKIINITYSDLDFAKQFVKENFSEFPEIQFFYTENTPEFHEVTPFIEKLMPAVFSTNENEYTFYGNSKGVSRYRDPSKESVSIMWAATLYYENLKDFNRIPEILSKYSCCGCFKLNRPYTAVSFVNWHFSGTFFWFNNKKLFSKDTWRQIYGSRYGVEGYMATHFPTEESFCLAHELPDGKEDIYNWNNWESFYRG